MHIWSKQKLINRLRAQWEAKLKMNKEEFITSLHRQQTQFSQQHEKGEVQLQV